MTTLVLHILGEKEISVSSLIVELSLMAESEPGEDRLGMIADARRWLKGFMTPGHCEQMVLLWRAVSRPDDGWISRRVGVRIRPENDDEQ
ncbi:hypothetical protein [Pantoea sp. At-9b]|uniref:hypothetical protein n=1 Tax=Pantoea sp. (strain At-9b) TaxID=592316 RepID=UPI0001B40439|nr:hypothetical protein [Pantoea sp. At-9b]ADU72118.1 hypothetical protein Pat9b_4790 [Pantoea sp. At-9b]